MFTRCHVVAGRAILVAVGIAALGSSNVSPAGGAGSSVADVRAFGDAKSFGSTDSTSFNQPIVGIAATPSSCGYWEAAVDGGVYAFGDAHFYGSTGDRHLDQPVVGIAATPTGKGYWLAARDGGIFTFGDAHFYGSTAGTHLNQPVVGIAATPTGKGYWLAARDGGIFTFGDAHFYGSTAGTHLNQPIVGIAARPVNGKGYWLAARDGGIFTFGDAHFYGAIGNRHLDQTIVGIAARPAPDGYWIVGSAGRVWAFGSATEVGDAGAGLSQPAVAIAPTRTGRGYWIAGHGTPSVLPGPVRYINAVHFRHNSEIEMHWYSVPGADGYRVFRATSAGGPFSLAADVNVTTGRTTAAKGVRRISGEIQTFYPPALVTPAPPSPTHRFNYVEAVTGPSDPRRYYEVTAYNAAGSAPTSSAVCAPIAAAC